jgi:hypothetical protein
MADQTQQFLDAIKHYCDGYTVAVGCRGEQCEHADGDPEHSCESFFSWQRCDSCGSTLGGDRTPASFIPFDFKAGDDTIIDGDICIDCALFWANGDVPETWQ